MRRENAMEFLMIKEDAITGIGKNILGLKTFSILFLVKMKNKNLFYIN